MHCALGACAFTLCCLWPQYGCCCFFGGSRKFDCFIGSFESFSFFDSVNWNNFVFNGKIFGHETHLQSISFILFCFERLLNQLLNATDISIFYIIPFPRCNQQCICNTTKTTNFIYYSYLLSIHPWPNTIYSNENYSFAFFPLNIKIHLSWGIFYIVFFSSSLPLSLVSLPFFGLI